MKFGEFITPVGQKGNIFKVDDWLKMILGSAVMLFAFGWGQRVYQEGNKHLPSGMKENIEPVFNQPRITGSDTIL
ncbi:MAG: hypothetical protein N4A68_07530 [Maledivibacter sp.]|nr:hypothetical protein [Maledivibacter sp.]